MRVHVRSSVNMFFASHRKFTGIDVLYFQLLKWSIQKLKEVMEVYPHSRGHCARRMRNWGAACHVTPMLLSPRPLYHIPRPLAPHIWTACSCMRGHSSNIITVACLGTGTGENWTVVVEFAFLEICLFSLVWSICAVMVFFTLVFRL